MHYFKPHHVINFQETKTLMISKGLAQRNVCIEICLKKIPVNLEKIIDNLIFKCLMVLKNEIIK